MNSIVLFSFFVHFWFLSLLFSFGFLPKKKRKIKPHTHTRRPTTRSTRRTSSRRTRSLFQKSKKDTDTNKIDTNRKRKEEKNFLFFLNFFLVVAVTSFSMRSFRRIIRPADDIDRRWHALDTHRICSRPLSRSPNHYALKRSRTVF